jgi:hypothetical protein
MRTAEGQAIFEEMKGHFPQREVVQMDMQRDLAIAFCAWLRRIDESEAPAPELWQSAAERIVLTRVRVQLERNLELTSGNPPLALSRIEALVLGPWAGRDALFERLLTRESDEQHALWHLEAWLEHELFVEYSDKRYGAIIDSAREQVISDDRDAN